MKHILLLMTALIFGWAASPVSATPLNYNINRDKLRDRDGQTLTEKIRLTSRAYLQLDTSEAERLLRESIDLILTHPPYPTLQNDLAQLASLNLVLREERPETLLLIDPFPIRLEPSFQKNISDRMREFWANQSRRSIEIEALSEFSSLRLMGEEVKPPMRMYEGQYLVHGIKNSKNVSGWLYVSAKDGVRFEKVHEIAPNLMIAETNNTARKETSRLNDWIQSEMQSSSSSPSIDPTLLDLNRASSIGNQDKPIYQKPWFWIAVGLISGLGGYATYQAMRSPTVVNLP